MMIKRALIDKDALANEARNNKQEQSIKFIPASNDSDRSRK